MSDEFETDSEGIKNLRKQVEELAKQNKTLLEENGKLSAKTRKREIADKLTDLGAKPGIANFVPSDIEVDSVGEWLMENGDLFGWAPVKQESTPANDAEAAAQARMSSLETPQSPDTDPDLTRILSVGSADELTAMINAARGGQI